MVTAEQISCQRPGYVEATIETTGTDVVFKGPGLPVAFIFTAITDGASIVVDVAYDEPNSTWEDGVCTCRFWSDGADKTVRIIPIYGHTSSGADLTP